LLPLRLGNVTGARTGASSDGKEESPQYEPLENVEPIEVENIEEDVNRVDMFEQKRQDEGEHKSVHAPAFLNDWG
jgi:hypothetical protein